MIILAHIQATLTNKVIKKAEQCWTKQNSCSFLLRAVGIQKLGYVNKSVQTYTGSHVLQMLACRV